MLLRCLANELTLPQMRRLGNHYSPGQQFPVQPGKEYVCFGLRFWSAGSWVDVEGPSGYLVTVPLSLFSIVDGSVPAIWIAGTDQDGDVALLPKAFQDPCFLDDLSEGKPEAWAAFRDVKSQLMMD